MNPPPATHEQSVALRRVNASDGEFLFQVYTSTRQEELAHVGWSESQQHSFLEMQFQAQRRYYESEYPGAEFQIILADRQPAGRLYVHRREIEIRIMDLALLPAYRRRGLGTRLLKAILDEGAQSNRHVTIHVEIFNPALQLYERLGFRRIATNGVYHLLQWMPTGSQFTPQSIPSQNQ